MTTSGGVSVVGGASSTGGGTCGVVSGGGGSGVGAWSGLSSVGGSGIWAATPPAWRATREPTSRALSKKRLRTLFITCSPRAPRKAPSIRQTYDKHTRSCIRDRVEEIYARLRSSESRSVIRVRLSAAHLPLAVLRSGSCCPPPENLHGRLGGKRHGRASGSDPGEGEEASPSHEEHEGQRHEPGGVCPGECEVPLDHGPQDLSTGQKRVNG